MQSFFKNNRGLVFNLFFVISYLLFVPFVGDIENLPIWLISLILFAIFGEVFAIFYKVVSISYRLKIEKSLLPFGFIFLSFFSAIRIAVFTLITDLVLKSYFGIESPGLINSIILFFAIKETLIWLIFLKGWKQERKFEDNVYLEMASDLVLLIILQTSYLLLDELFIVPAIDLSLPAFSILILTILFVFLFSLFFIPFRAVYVVEEYHGRKLGGAYILSWIAVLTVFLWPQFYNSEKNTEYFLEFLSNREISDEISFIEEKRISPEALENICEIEGLKKIRLNTSFSSYLPTCFYESLNELEYLDLSNNRFSSLGDFSEMTNLEKLDLSGNLYSVEDLEKVKQELTHVEVVY